MAPLGHINLYKLDLASSSPSLRFVLDEGLLRLITMTVLMRLWLGDYWLLVIWRAELDTTAHKVSAREKRNDLWPRRDLTGSAESSSSATTGLHFYRLVTSIFFFIFNCFIIYLSFICISRGWLYISLLVSTHSHTFLAEVYCAFCPNSFSSQSSVCWFPEYFHIIPYRSGCYKNYCSLRKTVLLGENVK